ncbi:MAG: FKBP-type peptidyl-prolyl cis-trans isomerase SlpA [Candidatus Electronema aureum]|uniref:Peptidyl-prolyl cis-trans isomerase n=1 Tax=Candidatus Electronema aureum TaxID=2005002 RepID=A0A521G532_9BACT|nr:MAG: FKBP-type peptidyl-prolyl cis-trans isomerase SlpA [Candidatus Electronema aureum]
MPIVSLTDTVIIRYTAALENGELIEKTDKPVTVSIGSGTVCPAVEACLFGMEPGQTRVIRVQPEDAYGLHLPELVQDIPLAAFQGKLVPQSGMILSLNVQREGQNCQVPATVTAVRNDTVTVDYNHPLAGQIIVYTVNLVSIAE